MSIDIWHHGGVEGVTGSCHELVIGEKDSVLVDCGLFQGKEVSPHGAHFEQMKIDFPLTRVRALLVTHCHLDHVGRIPFLLAEGFKGPIICSQPTAKLLPLVLQDAVKIGLTRDSHLIERFIDTIEQQIVALDYGKWFPIELEHPSSSLSVCFQPAGHVLGSSYIQCQTQSSSASKRIVFSGDLGARDTPILVDPQSPEKCDILVLESTYGDKNHDGRELRQQRMKEVVERCFRDRGIIIIPAFSIGRTQELLYEFEQIIHQFGDEFAHDKGTWSEVEVVVDSPLASHFTEIYQQLKTFWDAEAKYKVETGRHPLSFEQITTIDTHQEHLQTVEYLKKTARPTIVIAASGMCTGGRVVNYLKAMLEDPRTDVVFVGYQAYGTPGRDIQKYGPQHGYVDFDGERYSIHAQVHTLSGYSAHADQSDLLAFVQGIDEKPSEIRLVHGDRYAKYQLQQKLQQLFPKIEVVIPTSVSEK